MRKIPMLLKLFATGSLTLMLSACYGVLVGFTDKRVKLTAKNQRGELIPDLKISYAGAHRDANLSEDYEFWYEAGETDEKGELVINAMVDEFDSLFIKAEDVDGVANLGDFQTEIIVTDDEDTDIIMDEK